MNRRPGGSYSSARNQLPPAALLVLLLVTLGSAAYPPLVEALTFTESFAYVVNSTSGSVSVIDLVSNTVIKTIPVGNFPRRVVFTPNGEKAYVTNHGSDTVSVIDTDDHEVVKTVPVGANPWALDVAPDDTKVYVGNVGSNDVSIIDTATDDVIDTFTHPSLLDPSGVAFDPGGSEVLVSCGGGNNCIKEFSYPDNADIGAIPGVVGSAESLDFLPDGSFAFASNGCGCCGNVQKIDYLASNSVVATHFFNGNGAGLAIAHDGSTVYAGTQGHCGGGGNQVKKFNTSLGVTGTVSLGSELPQAIAVTHDGSLLYVTSVLGVNLGSVLIVDTASMTVVGSPIAVGLSPIDIAIKPTEDEDEGDEDEEEGDD